MAPMGSRGETPALPSLPLRKHLPTGPHPLHPPPLHRLHLEQPAGEHDLVARPGHPAQQRQQQPGQWCDSCPPPAGRAASAAPSARPPASCRPPSGCPAAPPGRRLCRAVARTSPTIASSTSAAVTTPSKLPYSSITSASPSGSDFSRSSASSAVIVSGTTIGWRSAAATDSSLPLRMRSSMSLACTTPTTLSIEPSHTTKRLCGAAFSAAAMSRPGVAAVDPGDLVARGHDRAHRLVGQAQQPLDHVALADLQHAGLRALGQQRLQLLLGHRLAPARSLPNRRSTRPVDRPSTHTNGPRPALSTPAAGRCGRPPPPAGAGRAAWAPARPAPASGRC